MVGADLGRGAEKKAVLSGLDHRQIVVGIPGSDRGKADGLQRLYRGELGFFTPHMVARDLSVLPDLQRVAEQRRIRKLLHQRHCKLLEGIA